MVRWCRRCASMVLPCFCSSSRHHSSSLRMQGKTIEDRKSTRLNSSHTVISYAVFCLKKKKKEAFTDFPEWSGCYCGFYDTSVDECDSTAKAVPAHREARDERIASGRAHS